MSRATFALLFAVAGCSVGRAGEFRLEGRTLAVPDGFTIERVAGPPLVDRPIVADFDEEGRLYVADSSGTNENVKKQLEDRPHRIVRLEDTDGDGRFDRRAVFADRMMFPEGAMWRDGSLYVSAPPSIWKLTDTDGDGVADARSEWFRGKTLTGCANDLHGPYNGPDGWIYWCKGAFAEQTYDRPGNKPFVTRAAHIFRARPDGSGIEPVMTGGMDNPVDVVFTPGGERIFTTTFLQNPGGGRRDGLIHAIYGGVYGKVHDVIEGHPRTGPDVMPVLAHLGPAAPCGLAIAESKALGDDYQGNLFACLFNLQKVTRHVLRPDGASFSATIEDFVTSPDRDFHPTDVLEDADGSLLVIDTGGWYKLCCPTSQLYKPDVLGAIYRVRKAGAPRVDDPRGRTLTWAELSPVDLSRFLDDPRPAVRRRAVARLADLGADALPALRAASSPLARLNAVWTATRLDGPEARAFARGFLTDPDATVRHAAFHSVSLRRDRAAVADLIALAGDRRGDPASRRIAAEALGRIGDPSAVPALLAAAGAPNDRWLEHALTYALIEIGDPSATAAGLRLPASPATTRAALVALDQMDHGPLKADDVTPFLTATDPAVREAAAWIVGRHPEWGEALAGFLRARLDAPRLSDGARAELENQLARTAGAGSIQTLLAARLADPTTPEPTRLLILRALARSGVKEVPDSWIAALTTILTGADPALIRQAAASARALPVPPARAGALGPALLALARRDSSPVELRLEALAAVPGGLAEVPPDLFAFLVGRLDPLQPVAHRVAAAEVLAKARLSTAQLDALTDALAHAGPLELDRLLPAFAASSDDEIGRKLVAALERSPARASLRAEALKPRLAKFGPEVKQAAERLYARLDEGAGPQRARLEGLLSGLSGGDVRRGQAVFNGAKGACSACHSIGYLGGKLGPDLTKIGQVRAERDLLEAIVFPSASFVRSFEPMAVATRDGKVFNGLVRKDSADEIVLATGPDQDVRIPRDQVEEVRAGTVSVMPAGLDQQLTPQELADLVAFLKACR